VTGYHEVRVFTVKNAFLAKALPDGWKPFAVLNPQSGADIHVVCRRWVRQ
jgi:hypothetical protein